MKKIETFIRPVHWDNMHAALVQLGVSGTLRQVKTFGRTPPLRGVYRGSEYVQELSNELELSLTVQDELLDVTLAAIAQALGDAEISVSSVQILRRAETAKNSGAAVLTFGQQSPPFAAVQRCTIAPA